MRKNITLNYYFQAFCSFGITSMWMLYLVYKGMSLLQIGIMEALFHVFSFIFEVPTGAIADVFGRKKSLILGRIVAIMGYLIMLTCGSFTMLTIGFILSSLSYALTSGSNDALVYDSLKLLEDEGTFIDVNANLRIIDEICYNGGLILAGIISDYYFEGTYLLGIGLCVFAIGSASKMKEPISSKSERMNMKGYLKTLKDAYKVLKSDHYLFYLMSYSGVVQSCVACFYFYFQPYLKDVGFLGRSISILIFISGVAQTFSVRLAPVIARKISKRKIIDLNGVLIGVLLIGCTFIHPSLLLGIFVVINCLGSFVGPINDSEMNDRIASELRATLISVANMFYSLAMIIFFPSIGYIGDVLGIDKSFIFLGIGLLILRMILKTRYKEDLKEE